MSKSVKELLTKLNIVPNDIKLYTRALTHASFCNENSGDNYERLEFLGDAVLQVIVSNYLFSNDLSLAEGVLTKKRAQIVREMALNYYAEQIDLKNYIKIGKGVAEKGPNASIIADCFEAFLAAIYLDLGLDMASKFFLSIFKPLESKVSLIEDFKSTLQEYFAVDRKTLSYKTTYSGPPNQRDFYAEVLLEGTISLGKGKGTTKKEAEQQAAKQALSILALR